MRKMNDVISNYFKLLSYSITTNSVFNYYLKKTL